jgi:superfamily II DNA or RNA helicase/intein/homing endonuclease
MDIELRLDNNTTYIVGRLDSHIYQGLKKHLGYRPENAVFMMRQVAEKNKNRSWGNDWDGYISTVCYSAATCRCSIKKQGTHFPTGLASKAMSYLQSHGVSVIVTDCRSQVGKSLELEMSSDFETRDYQKEVIDSACNTDRGIIKVCTGGGKCINENSLNLTEDGLLTFKEMVNEKLLAGEYSLISKRCCTPLSDNGEDVSSHIYYDGINSKSISIETSYGFDIIGTRNHRVKVLSGSKLIWKNLNNIKIGDYAAIPHSAKMFGKEDSLSIDDAYWLGLLYGDGCLTRKNATKLTTADDHIEEFANKYARSKNLSIKKCYDKRRENTRDLSIYSVEYRKSLHDIGIDYSHSYEKQVPLIIRKSTQEVVASFIRGLYETDGYVTIEKGKSTINIALSSKKMIKQVQLLLLNFGIVSSMRRKQTSRRDSFVLTIYHNGILDFREYIGFDKNGYKFKQMQKAIENMSISNANFLILPEQKENILKIKKILKKIYGYHNLSKIIKSSGINKYAFNSWVRNDSHRRNPSMFYMGVLSDWILRLGEYDFTTKEMLKSKEMFELKEIAENIVFLIRNFVFDKIIKREEVVSSNYDFVIPETHSFVSQGFLNHNTSMASAIMANRGVSPMIFYVTSIDLLRQAKDELERFIKSNGMDISVGELSGLKKDIQDITVMTVQTAVKSLGGVWVKYDDEDFGKEKEDISSIKKDVKTLIQTSKLMMCDEVQHWAAETCQIISDNSYSARYRYGLSATPFRDSGDDILIDSCFGKVIADISASKLIGLNYLVQPKIMMIPIDNPKMSKKLSYANIYKDYIVYNAMRNNIISTLAQNMANDGRSVPILCKQIAHGKILEKLIPESKFLHGTHSAKKRKEHLDKMRSGEANITIASTIFDEGVDCRPLDGLILAGSGKSPTRALQRVGRVLRPYTYPNGRVKQQAMVVDFMDNCKYMLDHSKKRLKMYKSEPKFDVEVM